MQDHEQLEFFILFLPHIPAQFHGINYYENYA